VVADNLSERQTQVIDAESIIVERVGDFMNWLRNRSVAPTIAALREKLETLSADEIGWLMPKLTDASEKDRELIAQFAHRLVRKLLHEPIHQLSQATGNSDGRSIDMYAHAISRLFKLEQEAPDDESESGLL
jgi:glutamyl-tRNA reductase